LNLAWKYELIARGADKAPKHAIASLIVKQHRKPFEADSVEPPRQSGRLSKKLGRLGDPRDDVRKGRGNGGGVGLWKVAGRASADQFRQQYGVCIFPVCRILRSLRPPKTGIGRRHGREYASLSSTNFRKTPGCFLYSLFYQNKLKFPMKIGIFLPNWLGDLVMATPTLRAMRRRFGSSAKLIGIMRPHLADVLGGTSWLDEQWYFHPRSDDPEVRHWALIRKMRQERIDVALLLPNSLRTALVARLGGAKQRVGYARYGRGPLLTQKVNSPQSGGLNKPCPMVDYFLRLSEAMGCPPESRRLELATTLEDERSADLVWERLGLRTDGRVITFNCSGAYGSAKLWPIEHFGDLAKRVATNLDHDVLVLCGPKERRIARAIAGRADHPRVFSMADQPIDLGTAKACIRRARAMVSTDSGPRHVAAAFGKPVITLYGPMPPVLGENPTVLAIDLRLDLDCIGCQNRVCPLGHHKCMRDLTPDMVYREIARVVREDQTAYAA